MEKEALHARMRVLTRAMPLLRDQLPTSAAPGPARPAIVCTARDVQNSIHDWCAFHLAAGFVHLFIYFDAPEESMALNLENTYGAGRVTSIPVDVRLRREWRTLPGAASHPKSPA